jgi:branched-chain amino acid transport system permease protein
LTPQYWLFWVGLLFVILVLVGRDRVMRWPMLLRDRLAAGSAAREAASPETGR